MDNFFSWDYMTTVPGPNEVFGTFSTIYLSVFVIGFFVSLVVYNGWARRIFPNPVLHRMAQRWSGYGLILFTVGLFMFAIRWLQINPFTLGMRIWMWLAWITLICLIVYIILDYAMNYQDNLIEYQQQQQRRRANQPLARTSAELARAGGADSYRLSRPRPVRRKRK